MLDEQFVNMDTNRRNAVLKKSEEDFDPTRRAEFIKKIPPGTTINHVGTFDFGTTVGRLQIYKELSKFVAVTNVNGQLKKESVWPTNSVVKRK